VNIFKKLFSPKNDSFEKFIATIDQIAEPAMHLLKNENDSFSKLGGMPNLGNDFNWPYHNGIPLAFICQLKLSEIANNCMADLPSKGLLFIFYIQDQSTWGFDPKDKGSWITLYLEDETLRAETEFPKDLDDFSKYKEKNISFNRIKTYPNWEDSRIEKLKMNDEEFAKYEEYKNSYFMNNPQHQIGGIPNPQQSAEMYNECQLVSNGIYCGDPSGYKDPRVPELLKNGNDWVLLLQIDSDDDCGMMWGDVGMLYFWIKKEDLRNKTFNNTWMILQCG